MSHVRFLTSHDGTVPATWSGHVRLLASSLSQLGFAFGWPAVLTMAAAVAGTALTPGARDRLWLLLPIASYYICFVSAVRVNFDRFFLPVGVLLAVLVGCWVMDVAGRIPAGAARRATATAAAIAWIYTAVYGASIDVMMLFDARYAAERWLLSHADGDRIGTAGYLYYQPRIAGFQNVPLTYEALVNLRPRVVVLNTEHLSRYAPESDLAFLVAKVRDGSTYKLAFSHKSQFRWSPLAARPQFSNRREDPLTNLDKINPEIQIYERLD
jgi:hypothetical protein